MGMGCYLDTYVVVEYYNVVTDKWEPLHFQTNEEQEDYNQFLERWGDDHPGLWREVKEYAVHARNCTYSGCHWQAVDTEQPTG